MRPQWNLAYAVGIEPLEAMTVCFEPNFDLDDDFLADARGKFARVDKRALDFVQMSEGGFIEARIIQ